MTTIIGHPRISGVTATTALPLADCDVPFSSVVCEGGEPNAARVSANLRYVAVRRLARALRAQAGSRR